jgi:drug/metabolite transporter (DMT)-like permease
MWRRRSPAGLALALASGALASGLGYSLWYAALPRPRAAPEALRGRDAAR